jgi:site-specific DNA recombinase
MKRAVIYARVSTERQADEGLSVDSQIEACRRKAAELGAAVLHVYRDDGISGRTDARPGFRAAVHHCTVASADYMLCWSSSRFARDQLDALTYKRELAAAGVRLVYANSGIDLDTTEGWLADSFAQIIDEAYSRQVSSDTKRSMLSAAREGFWMGGRLPYGYQATTAPGTKRRRLVVQQDEGAVVQRMFEQSARGIGAFAIAAALNAEGFTLRGRPWNKNTVLGILKSEVYMGEVIFNRFDRKRRKPRPESEWVRVQAHEPLVTPDRFKAVQDGLAGREPTAGSVPGNTQHIFAGLMKCGLCGAGLRMATGTGRGGKTYHYYACQASLQGRKCEFKRLPADKFDAWALGELLDRVLSRENVQGVIDQLEQAAATWVKDRGARRRALVAELREAEGKRGRLYEVLEVGGKNSPGVNELGPRLRELNELIKRLEIALVQLEDEEEPPVPQLAANAEDAERVLREMVASCDSPLALRDFVASIVSGIEVGLQEVRVDYHPECLVRSGGARVHSTSNWLPVVGTLRTITVVLPAPRLWRGAALAA